MMAQPLRILVVDDSRIFRSALEDALRDYPGAKVVGSVWSGEKAIEFIRNTPPNLVTLDLNMPGQGGLETLSHIREFNTSRPRESPVGVLLVSALTDRGAAVTVEGLSRGAFDFIRKPEGPDEGANAASLRQQLFEKLDLFTRRAGPSTMAPAPPRSAPAPISKVVRQGRFQAIAIGSSTGGPAALATLLPTLTSRTTVPLFLVQHLPEGMTRYFADSLQRRSEYHIIEAGDGDLVRPRTAYVAPSGRHMVLRKLAHGIQIGLNDLPKENGCRPSVDVFFRSAGDAYPRALIAVVLTGMGSDGAKGLGALKRSGAFVIAQDEATSVVWGMPGAAVATQLVDQVLPLDAIGPTIASMLEAGTSSCR